jgi:SEC-C motif-containing protein
MLARHRLSSHAPCPCDSGQTYVDCCGPWHAGLSQGLHAPTPEALMRSRYSAFVHKRADYLLTTWHSSTRPTSLDLDASAKWLGLEVREHQVTGADTAEVEFVARYRVQGRAVRMHERSRFVRDDGRWFYVDGDQRG